MPAPITASSEQILSQLAGKPGTYAAGRSVTRRQNSASRCARCARRLPAINAALIAPIDVPITQSGSMPDASIASNTPS